MKFDGEAKYCHSSLAHGPVSKSVKCVGNPRESDVLGADNEVKGEENLDLDFLESQTYNVDIDLLPSEKSAGGGVHGQEHHNYLFKKDSIIGRVNGSEDMVAHCSVPIAEVELSEKEAELYTDKTVTEIKLPEMIVCFKEGSCHVVKDICIDEGLHSQDRILLPVNQLDHKTVTGFPHYDWDEESDLARIENNGTIGLKSLTMKGQLISCENKEAAKQITPVSLQIEGGDNYDTKTDTVNEVGNGVSALDGLITLRQLISGEDMDSEQSSPRSLPEGGDVESMNEMLHEFSNGKAMSDKPVSVQQLDAMDINDHRQANQVACEDSTSTLPSGGEESKTNHGMVLQFSSKMESRSISFDFDTHEPATSGRDDQKENTDGQESARYLVEPGHQVVVLEGASASSRSLLAQLDQEDTSFAAAGVFSGPIAYSGSIPYSGSISLRSDSSTASTRSFAFPILHSEWNSSPVKMAKADRSLYRKHRGWLANLFCCRF